ncbi:hypothetical protein CG736_14785 [Kitasatospora sp. CB02891]|nr:hypothetical protein CG736_14785 [Kitasatospora sp. CB02891]
MVMSAATPESSSNSGYTRAALDGLTPAAPECLPVLHAAVRPRQDAGLGVGRLAPGVPPGPPGPRAQRPPQDSLVADHRLDSPHGEHSPLLKPYQSRAQALLLGVTLNRCVAWNLAAGRTPNPPTAIESCVVHTRDDSRTWVRFTAGRRPRPDRTGAPRPPGDPTPRQPKPRVPAERGPHRRVLPLRATPSAATANRSGGWVVP